MCIAQDENVACFCQQSSDNNNIFMLYIFHFADKNILFNYVLEKYASKAGTERPKEHI